MISLPLLCSRPGVGVSAERLGGAEDASRSLQPRGDAGGGAWGWPEGRAVMGVFLWRWGEGAAVPGALAPGWAKGAAGTGDFARGRGEGAADMGVLACGRAGGAAVADVFLWRWPEAPAVAGGVEFFRVEPQAVAGFAEEMGARSRRRLCVGAGAGSIFPTGLSVSGGWFSNQTKKRRRARGEWLGAYLESERYQHGM